MQVESWRMEIFEMGFCFVLVMHVFDCYAIYHSCKSSLQETTYASLVLGLQANMHQLGHASPF